jgi:uncharacterized protein (DUF3084 family)
MSSAGQLLVAGRLPGEVIGTPTVVVADSSTFTTTESGALASVTVPLISGRTYRVRFTGGWNSTVLADTITVRLREDTASGTQVDSDTINTPLVSSLRGGKVSVEGRYTATATANKTFVVTGQREAGTGNCRLAASTLRPAILEVLYESG